MATGAIPFDETCIMCPRRGKLCKGCKDAKYCSVDCQKLDRKNHRIFCGKEEKPRPDKDHVRCLFFPGGEEPPRFVWVAARSASAGVYCESFNREPFFGQKTEEYERITHNTIQARDVPTNDKEGLEFVLLDEAYLEPPNLSMRAFTRAGTASWLFRGPYLILHYGKPDIWDYDSYMDMTMRDIRNAADAMTVWYRNGKKDGLLEPERLLCGLMYSTTLPNPTPDGTVYQEEYSLEVRNGCDSVFSYEGSGIANLLGIPLLVRPIGPKGDRNRIGPNPIGAMLMRDITSTIVTERFAKDTKPMFPPDSPLAGMFAPEPERHHGLFGFGCSPAGFYRDGLGPVLVSRVDGLPLLSYHLKALSSYIREVVEPLLQKSIQGLKAGDAVSDRERILNLITKDHFLGYWDIYKQVLLDELRKDCPQMTLAEMPMTPDYPSPYDIKKSHLKRIAAFKESLYAQGVAAGVRQDSEQPVSGMDFGRGMMELAAKGPYGL